jgi:hypothetical protein
MHNPLIGNSLDSLRLDVRNANYPATTQGLDAQQVAIDNREHEVLQLVRTHEDDLVATAEEVHRSGDPVLTQADELLTEMSDLRTDIERAGTSTGAEHAARFESIRHRMQSRINELAGVEREAEFQAAKVADPYGSLDNIRRKYPQIVAGRRLS